MVRDSSDSFSGPSRLRAFTSAIGLTSPVSKGSSTAGSVNTDPPVTRNERAVTTSSYPTRGGFTLFLRVHSARKLPAVTQGSYCKLYVGETPITGGFGEGKTLASLTKKAGGRAPPTHRTFHTKVQLAAQKDCPEWNEKFQVNVFNPTSEILTIRVKNQVLVYSPAVGACTVHLGQLRLGETVDNWFPLIKSSKPAGSIRLQLCLQADAAQPELASTMARDSGVSEETIQRLVREHREQQESMRRQMEIRQQEKWKRIEEEELKHQDIIKAIKTQISVYAETQEKPPELRKQCFIFVIIIDLVIGRREAPPQAKEEKSEESQGEDSIKEAV
ncbi:hypothetical protein PHYBOEH_004860 [Phytophthora boehmeriae]|uniref:C2 domain-containing protein n=1 Tax=Phytophthora boehmeriae TaxID=109152 RepID=A0A8T1WKT1_9STRA|nr:hypothetical protein PHYBOEH_004860 [Phytophthora boehmeriae]